MAAIEIDTTKYEQEIKAIRHALLSVESHIKAFLDVLSQGRILAPSVVYKLPQLTAEDIGVDVVDIPVQPVIGERSLSHYAHHVLDFRIDHDHPGMMAKRLPGVLIVEHNEEIELMERVAHINALKSQFHNIVTGVAKNKDVRHAIMVEAVPLCIRKSVERNLLLCPQNCQSINFSFTRRLSMPKRTFTKEQLEQDLIQSVKFSKNPAKQQEQVDIDIASLKNANHAHHFRVARPLRVNPVYNFYLTKPEINEQGKLKKSRSKTAVAHTPVLCINQAPNIGTLKSYIGQSTADNPLGDPVIERLHVYADNRAVSL
ncbi:MAG: hypothetical protein GJ680_18650 [Alteromonadaceae bacterium]|nr:hypothetical protein [Alteromonadaceae bacterium]